MECIQYLFPGPIKLNREDYDYEGLSSKTKKPPYFLNPFCLENAAILTSYFNVGIAWYFLSVPVSYYLITTLDISSTQYSAYNALIAIPWSLKFVFGLLSDGNPLLGYRRKSWYIVGWVGFILVNMSLAVTGPPNVDLTIGLMFLMSLLYLFADVCTDCLTVDRSRFESQEIKGTLQTSGYTIRAFGSIIGGSVI
jgi:MFS family permease